MRDYDLEFRLHDDGGLGHLGMRPVKLAFLILLATTVRAQTSGTVAFNQTAGGPKGKIL